MIARLAAETVRLEAECHRLASLNADLAAALKAAEFELHDRQCSAPRLAATLEGARAALDKHQGAFA
jgi:hypothetical protein